MPPGAEARRRDSTIDERGISQRYAQLGGRKRVPVDVRVRISSDNWGTFTAARVAVVVRPASDEQPDPRLDTFEFRGERMTPLGEWAYAPIVPTRVMGLRAAPTCRSLA